MKIAVVHSYYSSRMPSGENTVVDEQVRTLRDAGHEVRLIARRTDDEERAAGYAVRSAATVATGFGPSPEAELTAFAPDVVHVHNTFPNFGTRWLKRWGPRTVLTVHNYRSACAAATLYRDGAECTECLTKRPAVPAVRYGCYRGSRLATVPVALGASPGGGLRRILTEPAQLVALNSRMAEILGPLTPRSISVIPNFVRHAETSVPVDARSWVFVGRVTEEKGLARLLERWPEGHRLDVVGTGPQADQLVARFPLPAVTWRGALPRDQVLAELGRYTGLLIPSGWSEGIPTVALEALARGVPIGVSREVASGPDLVRAGAARILELEAGTRELQQGLERISQDPTARQSARQLHTHSYSPEAWLSQILPIYQHLSGS